MWCVSGSWACGCVVWFALAKDLGLCKAMGRHCCVRVFHGAFSFSRSFSVEGRMACIGMHVLLLAVTSVC